MSPLRHQHDKDHHPPGLLELGDHFLKAMSPDNLGSLCFILEKIVDLLRCSVVGAHLEAVIIHVEDEVLAHDGKADEGDVAIRGGHLANCSSVAHQVLTTTINIIITFT